MTEQKGLWVIITGLTIYIFAVLILGVVLQQPPNTVLVGIGVGIIIMFGGGLIMAKARKSQKDDGDE